jgi:uncharacterized paraquat-inducible protein A
MSRGPGIDARFQSICPRCGHDITPGQRVVRRRDTYIHVHCASGADDE